MLNSNVNVLYHLQSLVWKQAKWIEPDRPKHVKQITHHIKFNIRDDNAFIYLITLYLFICLIICFFNRAQGWCHSTVLLCDWISSSVIDFNAREHPLIFAAFCASQWQKKVFYSILNQVVENQFHITFAKYVWKTIPEGGLGRTPPWVNYTTYS